MAEEIEEPLSAGFRMESLHSGSISFGRFESEDLSWERRSSFNHNKYLEEVGKCSKPGSVIEKKAYFEAHFKKKGILIPSHVEFGSEYQVTENDRHGEEDYDVHEIENEPYYDEIAIEDADYEEHHYEMEGGRFAYGYSGSSYANVDESPDDFQYHGNYEGRECEREYLVSDHLSPEHQMDAIVSSEGAAETVELKEANQIEIPKNKMHLNSDELQIQIKDDLNDDDHSHRSSTTCKADKVLEPYHQNHPELKTAIDGKTIKSRSKSQLRANEIPKSPNSDKSKASVKSQTRRERMNPHRAKLEKHSPRASRDSRQHFGNKSEKEPKQKKVVGSQSSGPKRNEHTSRHNQTVGLTKPEWRPTASTFTFKSSERAERRKEFYMKLETKMNAKEAEMNQIQAKTQEKAEAEIKKFRRSLNFKATPMPSFYHSSAKPTSTANKGVLPSTRPSKVQDKVTGSGNGTAVRSHLISNEVRNRAILVTDSSKLADQPESSGATDSSTMEICYSSDNRSTEVGIRKKQQKQKIISARRALEKSKVPRDQKNEGKLEAENGRNDGEMVRKNMKGVGISSSKIGRPAVGVTP